MMELGRLSSEGHSDLNEAEQLFKEKPGNLIGHVSVRSPGSILNAQDWAI